jgi:hypothetical protein
LNKIELLRREKQKKKQIINRFSDSIHFESGITFQRPFETKQTSLISFKNFREKIGEKNAPDDAHSTNDRVTVMS